MINIHFSDFFDVSAETLEEYGAFNVSLINDLPVFIDPFLIFNSQNSSYQKLHNNIITYLKFLRDKSLVEFKLASNTQLKRNLQKQVAIYEKASDTEQSLKVIIYFSARELARVGKILRELGLRDKSDIILIDACADNKPSASKA